MVRRRDDSKAGGLGSGADGPLPFDRAWPDGTEAGRETRHGRFVEGFTGKATAFRLHCLLSP